MIRITITCEIIGQARLYELRGRAGKQALIPTYHLEAIDDTTNERFVSAVTRSASRLVFATPTDPFGVYGECPPSKPNKPYRAFASTTSTGTFCLRLYETPEPQTSNIIHGLGTIPRTNIMIHRGPGMSQGCLMIAGGVKGHLRFVRWMKTRIKSDTIIEVTVLPYL